MVLDANPLFLCLPGQYRFLIVTGIFEPDARASRKGVADLDAALAALLAAEMVHERAIYPVAEYAFKHPLTHEVALGAQLTTARRARHAAVAEAIAAARS